MTNTNTNSFAGSSTSYYHGYVYQDPVYPYAIQQYAPQSYIVPPQYAPQQYTLQQYVSPQQTYIAPQHYTPQQYALQQYAPPVQYALTVQYAPPVQQVPEQFPYTPLPLPPPLEQQQQQQEHEQQMIPMDQIEYYTVPGCDKICVYSVNGEMSMSLIDGTTWQLRSPHGRRLTTDERDRKYLQTLLIKHPVYGDSGLISNYWNVDIKDEMDKIWEKFARIERWRQATATAVAAEE